MNGYHMKLMLQHDAGDILKLHIISSLMIRVAKS